MQEVVNKLQADRHRSSTKNTYYRIWKNFNKFFIKLDVKPAMEEALNLYVAFLIQNKKKSGTIRSYISAIKAILEVDGHPIKEDRATLNAMTRACRLQGTRKIIRFPIRKGLLYMMLKKIEELLDTQPYLEILYKALFATTYFGMFRIGELTYSEHVIKACDVMIGVNKNKLMFVLYSSKTHTQEGKPQIIKISAQHDGKLAWNYCPFRLLESYIDMRQPNEQDDEPFFVFRDKSPVYPHHFRKMLKKVLKSLNFDHRRYVVHGLRAGRSVDLLNMGLSVETIMKLGRWKSNAVFTYLAEI